MFGKVTLAFCALTLAADEIDAGDELSLPTAPAERLLISPKINEAEKASAINVNAVNDLFMFVSLMSFTLSLDRRMFI